MNTRIVAFSGHIGSGKTSACGALRNRHPSLEYLSTGELLKEYSAQLYTRAGAQVSGRSLDEETNGEWVSEALAKHLRMLVTGPPEIVLLDCVRVDEQLTALRESFGSNVVHVHLTAPIDERRKRYQSRKRVLDKDTTFEEASADPTERSVAFLEGKADLRIDSMKATPDDCAVIVASFLGLHGQHASPIVDVLVGGQYGSEGKGNLAHYLSKEYKLLVRVGGPNAGHKVYERPEPYTHHHLPSGTRNSEARLLLAAGSSLYVPGLLQEINQCEVTPERLSIDPQAIIIDEADRSEERKLLVASIASTAQGVGFAAARKIYRGAGGKQPRLAKDVPELKPYIRDSCQVLEDIFAAGGKVFLEGTQGTGLSLHHGHYPYVTSRETSASGCLAEAGISPKHVRRIIMVCRTYPIRVAGNSGTFPRQISWPEVERRSGLRRQQLSKTERTSTTNRARKVSEFDWSMFRRAVLINGPTDIALTFVDYLDQCNQQARRFEQLSLETVSFIEALEYVSGAPVSLITTRFHYRSIIDRRTWK